jgi:hypothetical protein
MVQLTVSSQRWMSDKEHEIVVVDDYTEINNHMDGYDLVFVQTAGDMVFERDYLYNKLENFPKDIGFMGHLIWYPHEVSPWLHPQCFVFRPEAINNFLDFSTGNDFGKKFIASAENMHDDHAPLWITYDTKEGERQLDFGTKVFASVLDNGYKLYNFNKNWRFSDTSNYTPFVTSGMQFYMDLFEFHYVPARGYSYPEDQSDLFSSALQSLEVLPGLDDVHSCWIEFFLAIGEANKKVVNIFHADWDSDMPTANRIICPANGLHGEIEALNKGADTIIFYDYNNNNIEFKKHLYANWGGVDYKSFAEAWANERNLLIEPRWENSVVMSQMHNDKYKEVEQRWNDIKQLTVEFHNIDLITDINLITDKIVNKTVIHTSTILTYFLPSQILHTAAEIENTRNLIQQAVNNTESEWFQS